MIGPTPGFNVNGGSYVTTACDRHYVVMNPTYERLDTVMHNYGHRLEQTMGYLSERWSAADRKQHWQDFSAIARYQVPGAPYNMVSCGNAHFAPNSQSAYDYGNQTQVSTSCPDWGNFPNYSGATTQVSCTDWGCNDNGWNEYWMAAVPRSDGDAQLSDVNAKPFQFPRDWWSLALYPDKAIAFRQMLEAL
jgi:hypothetical protein